MGISGRAPTEQGMQTLHPFRLLEGQSPGYPLGAPGMAMALTELWELVKRLSGNLWGAGRWGLGRFPGEGGQRLLGFWLRRG